MAPDETVQVDFSLTIGPGRLDVSASVPTAQTTLTQLLPVLHSISSNIIDSTVRVVESEGFTISCRAGCGACCRQIVPLSIFEAEYLAAWIRTLPSERRAQLAVRFHAALLTLSASGILARLDEHQAILGTPESKPLALDYLAQRVACPFLENESCSIHPIRPVICREYLVTSPAEFCSAPTRETVTPVPLPIKLSTPLYRIGAHLENNSRGRIPLVFLFAWMKSNATPGDSVAAPGPELLHEFIKLTVTT